MSEGRGKAEGPVGRHLVGALILVLAGLSILAGSAAADWGKTEYMVSCYAGDRNNNQYLGEVDVFDTRKAAQSCNLLYGDCNWNCSGCYMDEESKEVCIR